MRCDDRLHNPTQSALYENLTRKPVEYERSSEELVGLIRVKVTERWKNLNMAFRTFCDQGNSVDAGGFRRVLADFQIEAREEQYDEIVEIFTQGQGTSVSFQQFCDVINYQHKPSGQMFGDVGISPPVSPRPDAEPDEWEPLKLSEKAIQPMSQLPELSSKALSSPSRGRTPFTQRFHGKAEPVPGTYGQRGPVSGHIAR
jgi:hypothetical protein